MKRNMLVTTMVVLDTAEPYSGTTIRKCLDDTFGKSIEVVGWNSCSVLAHTVHEWTTPLAIAVTLANYLSDELDTFITAHKRGDNGDDDVGFKLIQHGVTSHLEKSGTKCLCDIAIKRHEGLWYISIDTADKLLEVNDLNDILEYLEA